MVIATDVKNLDGMLLIPAGASLTARQINILQAWGIDEVEVRASVAVPESDPLARLPAETVAQLSADLRRRFWQPHESNPVFTEIFRLMLRRRAQNYRAPSS